jgi:MFS-type transporter involved in bile tolerance (Atg22 family)
METLLYILGGVGIIMAGIWWLWVMTAICKTIEHRGEQKAILENLVEDVQELKKLLREIR